MAGNSFSANNTSLILNGRGLTAFVDGDIIELNSVNPQTARTRGSDLVNIQNRSDRNVHDLVMRIMMYSDDHAYLNSQMNQGAPVIFNGSLKVNYIESNGTDGVLSWSLKDGSFTTKPSQVINNTDGNSLAEYTIQFNEAILIL